MAFTMIHLRTKNTVNGNPRRLYLRIDGAGCIMGAWDEGYAGYGAVPAGYRDQAHRAVSIETTPKEYRRLLKEYGEKSKLTNKRQGGFAKNQLPR